MGMATFSSSERKNQGRFVFAEMVASCDENVRFWINAQQFKDRSLWQPGWQTLEEMNQPEEALDIL